MATAQIRSNAKGVSIVPIGQAESTDEVFDPLEDEEALTAEFRARLGLLDDDEGLTEAFKASIGLTSLMEDAPMFVQEEIQLPMDEEKDQTLASFKYTKWAKDKFLGGATDGWTKDPLSGPLMAKKNHVDFLAAQAVWLAIQRFMGDISTPKAPEKRDKTPVMTKIYRTLEAHAKRKNSSADYDAHPEIQSEQMSFKLRKRSSWKRFIRLGSGKSKDDDKSKSSPGTSNGTGEPAEPSSPLALMLEKIPTAELDIVHFIIGHGILRKELRDEVYCQLCKQLTRNPKKESEERGWMLMAMTCGCFLPSDEFDRYLRCFLKDAPVDFKNTYGSYCRKIIRRTMTNGTRYHPPNTLEYQAVQLRKYVMLPVTCADGRMETLEADSATSSGEMCDKLSNLIGLKDQFGFSVYICIYNKVSSLGSGLDHVMDAISECEQVMRHKMGKEAEAPWRLYFRKEIFSPWHDPAYDEVSTNLIYKQIARGIRSEEYKVKAEENLTKIAAQQTYIESGQQVVPGKLQQVIHRYLPESALKGTRTRDQWTQAVITSFEEQGFSKGTITQPKAKEDLIMMGARKWPLQFSGLFEAFKISGPRLPKNDAVIAINSRGFFILDEPYKVAVGMHYFEIVDIFHSRTGKTRGQSFSLVTVKGDEYTFISPNSQTITKLVGTFLNGLRKRSKYAVGLQEFILQGENLTPFRFKQGDLVELTQDKSGLPKKEDWSYGKCERTKSEGQFPLDCVYILPTVEKPPEDFLKLFTQMSAQETSTLPRKRGAVFLSTRQTLGRDSAA